MNIIIDIRPLVDAHRTGVGEYTFELLNALFKTDKTNQYVLFYNSYKDVANLVPKWTQKNVQYVATRWPNKLLSMLLWLRIITLDGLVSGQCLEVNDFDFCFSPNIHFTSISKKTKHILTVHDLSFEYFRDCYSWKRRLWHWVVNPRKQCGSADIILTPSKSTRRDVIEAYVINEKKVQWVNPGMSDFRCQISEYEPVRLQYNLQEKYIFFLGTIEPRKNILGLIKAFSTSSELRALNCELVIAGKKGWKYDDIMLAIEDTPRVRYIGYVDEEHKQVLYKHASIFVYPSLYEGFGFPVLEALQSGTKVVTSNRSSLPEVTKNLATLVNPYSVGDIRRGMESVMTNEGCTSYVMTQNDKRLQPYEWEEVAKQFLEMIQSI
jgi:glycosyltransferase involved in cell wall biosynthesis